VKILVEGEEEADAISVTGGQQSRVIEVNVGSVFAVNGQTGNVQLSGLTGWINATDAPYNADKTGLTDPTAAIQAAIDDCPPGGTVYLPPGVYATTATLDLKNGVSLRSDHANMMVGPGMTGSEYPCYIQPAATFTGDSVIQIIGDNDGTHPVISGEQRLTNLMIDGSKLGGSVDGLFARGNVQNVVLDNVTIRQMTNNGIVTASRTDGTFPFSWRLHHVMIDNCHANGLLLTGNTDLTLDDVQAIGCWAQGFVLTNCTNAQLQACRAEWNGSHGYHITGTWGDWQGSGGMQITGCSTDRNGQHGVFIDATGNTPILLTGLQLRRDGRNGGTGAGGYAGLAVIDATVPVAIDGITCYPGVDDSGTSTNSPQYGVRISGSTTVLLDDAILHADTAGLYDDGTNTIISLGVNVVTTAGATTATARTLRTRGIDWINASQYGATGDGTTDDTDAVQAAINALPGSGGTVYLPAGSYLLDGAAGLSITGGAVTLRGAGAEATKILIGSGFTGTTAISVTGANAQIVDLSVNGASATTTSNPAAHGITVSGARRLKVDSCQFWYLNGYAVRALATSSGSASNPHGTQLTRIRINQCAGGIHFLGNTAQGYAVNSFVTDVHIQQGGVSTGANANLDGIRIEDAWDVLVENAITWLSAGTGSACHIVGNCAASFIKNLDALGPTTAPNVLVEDGTNGSPQNVQINGGVIQQGSVGLKISGGSQHVHVDTVRIINNQSHGAQIDSSGLGIHLNNLFFSQSGQAATGTNYDINWSGSADGFISDCRFSSPVVATGTAGIQGVINIANSTVVRVLNANFAGTGSSSANWFPTNTPQLSTRVDAANYEMRGNLDMLFAAGQRLSLRPNAAGNNTLAFNVAGADVNDRFRLLGDGTAQYGTGTAARDTTWGRQGTAQIGTPDSDITIGLAGKTLRVKEGTNAKMGTATLNGTTAVTVSTTAVTSTSRIFLGFVTPAGTPGAPYVSAKTVGTSFQVKSVAGDTSLIAWWIVEAA
jgi:hypothetical protein